jgi:3-dehydroquinate synthase
LYLAGVATFTSYRKAVLVFLYLSPSTPHSPPSHERLLTSRLGAYHAPLHTFLDFSFLKTLPVGQVRNGFAELIKIATVGDKAVWDLLVKYGPKLVETGFGHKEGDEELKKAGQEICERGIETMLELESPNLHELGLDRVIAYGHTWSPTLELTPTIPLRHGHAITVCLALTLLDGS